MGNHIVKTTIEIADDLFHKVHALAQRENTTFRALTERGLRLILDGGPPRKKKKLPPLLTVKGKGLTEEFKNATWEQIRDEIYRGHGA